MEGNGFRPEQFDTVDDLFPGSGAVQAAINERLQAPVPPLDLFAGDAA